MTPVALSSSPTKNRQLRSSRNRSFGTNKLIAGKVPNFRSSTFNDSASSNDDEFGLSLNNKNGTKKNVVRDDENDAASSSSSASSSASGESDGGWSSSNNDFSSSHNEEEEEDDDAKEMMILRSTLRRRLNDSKTGDVKVEDMVDDGLQLLSDDEVEIDIMVNDEYISDSLLRVDAGSNNNMSYTSLPRQHQEQEQLHFSYDFDGVNIEAESVSSDECSTNNNDNNRNKSEIPTSVAIDIGAGHHQQQTNCFDISDPSIDDSINKNYDSRYDGSLKDLTSIGNLSGGSLHLTDVNYNIDDSNSSNDDDENNDVNRMKGYLSSNSEKLRGMPNVLLQPYVGERPPTPPSPVRKMIKKPKKSQNSAGCQNNMVDSPSNGNITTSPIKMISAVIRNTSTDRSPKIPFLLENDDEHTSPQHQSGNCANDDYCINNNDLFGSLQYDDDQENHLPRDDGLSTQKSTQISDITVQNQFNKQFDTFYPVEYGKNDNDNLERKQMSNRNLLDESIQQSCRYENDEENGAILNAATSSCGIVNIRHSNGGNKTIENRKFNENDNSSNLRRIVRRLFIALICALVALLAAVGGIIVLVHEVNQSPDTPSRNQQQNQDTAQPKEAPSQSPLVSTLAPVKVSTNPSPSSNIFKPVVSAPTTANAPIARNATASLINTPYASPITSTQQVPAVTVAPPTVLPTLASIQIP